MHPYTLAVSRFEGVNLAGAVSRAWCTWEGWQPAIVRDAAKHVETFGPFAHGGAQPAVVQGPHARPQPQAPGAAGPERISRLTLSYKILAAAMPAGYRILVGLLPQAAASLVGPMVRLITRTAAHHALWAVRVGSGLTLWPVMELVVGRGHLLLGQVDVSWALGEADAQGQWEFLAHFGLLGALFEGLPQVRAAHYLRHHHVQCAAACMLAATVGRILLQPPRLVLLAACLVTALPLAALAAALITAYDALLDGCGWALQAYPSVFVSAARVASWRHACVAGQAYPWVCTLAHPQAALRPGPQISPWVAPQVSNEQVREFMNQQLHKEFASQGPSDAEAEAAYVAAARDAIVARLHRLCRGDRGCEAYRWGMRLLDDYIAMSYDESLCAMASPEAA